MIHSIVPLGKEYFMETADNLNINKHFIEDKYYLAGPENFKPGYVRPLSDNSKLSGIEEVESSNRSAAEAPRPDSKASKKSRTEQMNDLFSREDESLAKTLKFNQAFKG